MNTFIPHVGQRVRMSAIRREDANNHPGLSDSVRFSPGAHGTVTEIEAEAYGFFAHVLWIDSRTRPGRILTTIQFFEDLEPDQHDS